MKDAAGPLQGCRVVDASVYLAGPFAGLQLGDLGAEVVKVEPPAGDPLRRFGKRRDGLGMMFVNMNRGKRLTTLDLKDPDGVAEFRKLVRDADVLVDNWRPGVAERIGLSDEVLWADNPGLIHCAVTGFGPTGPRSKSPAFDTVVQALSGLAWFHSRQGRPQVLRTYLVDKLAGTFTAQAILAALLDRTRTGLGRRIDVSMLAVAAYFNFPDIFATRTVTDDDERFDPEGEPGSNSVLPTSDGWIVVAPTGGGHVKRSCEAAGHPEWIEELRSIRDTNQLNPALMSRLASVTATGTTSHWVDAFAAADVPVAPVLDLDGNLADPQVTHSDLYPRHQHAELGEVRYARYPAAFMNPP